MKGFIKAFGIFIFIAIFAAVVGLCVWQYNFERIGERQRQEITETIINTIQREVSQGHLLPEVVFINNADTLRNEKISDSLVAFITKVLVEKYTKGSDLNIENISIKPFYVLPDQADSNGNYVLTQSQLSELKEYMMFLTKQVEKEVERTKQEVGHDIDRLNTWVSIWIGVIGFLGIFVPIVVNFDVTRSVNEAKSTAAEASKSAMLTNGIATSADLKVKEINKKVKVVENEMSKVDEALTRVSEIEQKVNELHTQVGIAAKNASDAIDESKESKAILATVVSIDRLSQIDAHTINHLKKHERLPFYSKVLNRILNELENNGLPFDNEILISWLGQIAISMQILSLFGKDNRVQTQLFNEYGEMITNFLEEGLDENKYGQIVLQLEALIGNLDEATPSD